MPRPSQHQSRERSRILFLGDSGAGKTGSIAGLVNSPLVERMFILDFDDGLDSLFTFADPKAAEEKVVFETLRDKVVQVPSRNGTRPAIRAPKAYSQAMKLLENGWTDSETGEEFGSIYDWGPKDWLVVDSLTHMGHAAMAYTLKANKRLGKPRRMNDWGDAIERQEAFLQELSGNEVKCNVLITAHLKHLRVAKTDKRTKDDDETEETLTNQRYPSALGQGLPGNVGSYFNVVLMADKRGSGAAARRFIRTQPTSDVDIKVPLPPKGVPSELSLDEGLVKIVKALQHKED